MQYRSWLMVPADSEKKLGKAASTGADVVVLDLAETVPFDRKPAARQMAAEWLAIHRQRVTDGPATGRWVRINALDSRMWREDLVVVMRGAPDGVLLPRAAGPQAVQQLAAEIYELEQSNHVPTGSTRILPLVSGTAQAAMTIGAYLDAPLPRLAGLTWDEFDLPASLGATRSRDAKGGWTDTFRFIRAQTLLTAHARGLMAIEGPNGETVDEKALKAAARNARADGFTGMFAIHPAQVPLINEAFAASDMELAEARAILEAGEGTALGTSGIDRRLIDPAQVKLARRMLGLEDGQQFENQVRTPILRPA